VVNAKSASLV